ncbi:uncharacterized protein BO72DRAFT_454383 [Aspergillus fijiensis CBS 313.89]|uniref:Uncharacterized protein n=1 Tax=Aspergillus fijiensis CBS 313.89 TaxID=1448319 RepID=A0A8G1W4E8_9EURO|nr:uncharacterized protein BO72DRAFT_454383 [Aspergillus fijiensis CBS 313.89]RAK82668.1 hypothetical protein BO72DRAFT_454383 [Aspergillus fijiensis CBS 313.89]
MYFMPLGMLGNRYLQIGIDADERKGKMKEKVQIEEDTNDTHRNPIQPSLEPNDEQPFPTLSMLRPGHFAIGKEQKIIRMKRGKGETDNENNQPGLHPVLFSRPTLVYAMMVLLANLSTETNRCQDDDDDDDDDVKDE